MCNITFCFVFSKRETIRELKRNSMQELQESFGWHYQWAFTNTAGGPSSVRLASRQHKISKLQHSLLQTRRLGRYNKPDGQTLFSEVEEKTRKMWRMVIPVRYNARSQAYQALSRHTRTNLPDNLYGKYLVIAMLKCLKYCYQGNWTTSNKNFLLLSTAFVWGTTLEGPIHS